MKLPKDITVIMEEKYAKYWWKEEEEREYNEISKDPFKLLIFTILSQNTSGVNTRRAYRGLRKKFDVNPYVLAKADERDIANAIKSGGLYKIKARRIKEISEYIIEKYGGDLKQIISKDKEEIKEELMKLPGVGNKTADVIISSIYGQRESFVIDTHMKRIAVRLGIADKKADYEEIQNALKNIFPWEDIPEEKQDRVAALFWLLAKYTCRARNPKCNECILKEMCKFYRKSE
jgi:endonuclease-3